MNLEALTVAALSMLFCCLAMAEETAPWWNGGWRFRTTIGRATPYRDAEPRPVEAVIDFPLLLEQADVKGKFAPSSVRVVARDRDGGREVPYVLRREWDAREGREQSYLAWMAQAKIGAVGRYDIYFDTVNKRIKAPKYDANVLPPANLLTNGTFEAAESGKPAGWAVSPDALVRLSKFAHTTGKLSLKIVVDEKTPAGASRDVTISQKLDVSRFAGQEMVFECDLMAERAAYGVPMTIQIQQFRADGTRIPEYAVEPRWLSLELAERQLVQFCERGRFSPRAASADVVVRLRCSVRDADTRARVAGPEAYFTIWLDRLVVRPGERWPWPALTHAGFVEGALTEAPLNRAFEFTGQRRLAFNGGSEGTLTSGRYNPNPKSVHWGVEAGTLEFWLRPNWDSDDGHGHALFTAKAYGHRLQTRLHKVDRANGNQLEFGIADAGRKFRTVRGPCDLKAGQWYHVAATWDFPKAQLQLFLDGRRIGAVGPGKTPWPSSIVPEGGEKKTRGMGIMDRDTRSLPMQAFIGGHLSWTNISGAEAAIDELRVSDVVRYSASFEPPRQELVTDEHTRALFHFENECEGVHDSDDGFVRGHLACELPRQEEQVVLEELKRGKVERHAVAVKSHASVEEFEENRAENRMMSRRPVAELPDPRFVEFRERSAECIVTGVDRGLAIDVGGDFEPLMRYVTFEHADGSTAKTTLLPRWRANDNVVPFSVETLRSTLAPNAETDGERAFETFKYSVETTNYFDAHYCETLPGGRHRSRISYTLIKALNIYPFDQCGPMNHMLRKLFLAAGISSTNASGTHHQFEQAFYDGDMRLFDLSSRIYWLDRDNRTVLSRRGMEDDPYLKLRQGGDPNAWLRGRKSGATFGTAERPHCMDFPLRPGERASICWHNEGRWFEVHGNRQPIHLAKIPPYFGNGAIVYEPTVGDATALENLAIEPKGVLRAVDPAKRATLIYKAACPYLFSDAQVRGRYTASGPSQVKLSISFDDGKKWTTVWSNGAAEGDLDAGLLKHVTGRYAYWLKIEIAAGSGAQVADATVRTTLVVSPLSLPGKLRRGKNQVRSVGVPATPVKTTCRWVERHRTDLGVSLNAISFYLNSGEAHRNVVVASPAGKTLISVALEGAGTGCRVALQGLPDGWIKPSAAASATTQFRLAPKDATPGDIRAFEVVVRGEGYERHVPAQVLVAQAPLVAEAEGADDVGGKVAPTDLPEASQARVMTFTGDGSLSFSLRKAQPGKHALWLRARWEPGSRTGLTLGLDRDRPRPLRAAAMIGFTTWGDRRRAHAKMYAHFGEQYGHWSWYRIGDVELAAGSKRLTLSAGAGTQFDALLLLPQNPTMDRAAMNLFQNWNYAPWDNPM